MREFISWRIPGGLKIIPQESQHWVSPRKLVSPPVMTLASQPGTVVYGLRNNRHRTLELKETSEIASPSFIDEKTGVGG